MSAATRSLSRILIVEDDALLAETLQTNLQDAGYADTRTAVTAEEAFSASSRLRPQIAIVDIGLSEAIDGITVGGFLADQGALVIYFSAHTDRAVLEGRGHAFDILPKTCRFEEVLRVVRSAEAEKRRRA